MNQKLKFLIPIFLILLLASCNEKEEKKHALPAPLEEVDTTYMKRSFLREIRNYVTEHDSCTVFLIWPEYSFQADPNANEYDYEFASDIDNETFHINEAYKYSFDGGEFTIVGCYPHRYIKIGEKYVFIHSRDDNLYDQRKLQSVFDKIDYKGYNYDSELKILVVYKYTDSCKAITIQSRIDSSQNFRPVFAPFKKSIKFTAPVK